MRTPRYVTLAIALFAILLIAGSVKADLALTIDTDKRAYLLKEPISASIAMENIGDHRASVVEAFDPGFSILSISITAPDGRTHAFVPIISFMMAKGMLSASILDLDPGERHTEVLDLTHDRSRVAGGTVLTQVGEYKLTAVYKVPAELPGGPITLTSNDISVRVDAPVGVDKEAYDLLNNDEHVVNGIIWTPYVSFIPLYEKVLTKYPDSAYAWCAQYFLASAYQVSGCTTGHGKPSGAQAVRHADALFRGIPKMKGGAEHEIMALLGSSRCLTRLGQIEAACSTLDTVFASPKATYNDRLDVIRGYDLIRNGDVQGSAGFAPVDPEIDVTQRLVEHAAALGVSIRLRAIGEP